ncbi:MAG: aminotransferase class III-fold pyridoxal phosphate-dependent enzyme, partial [Armatimonadota bacterium]|nr:aminotransferase class III-fold pyridoxal phosphate-dependent enzyme [Armatimonadota bacterium]
MIDLDARCGIQTYGRIPIAFQRGAGARLWDIEGKEYLDFLGGIAVVPAGHCHPRIVEAVSRQAATLIHSSNLYYIEPQVRLAELLTRHSFADRVFFCNSGAEANEAAIKIARKRAKAVGGEGKVNIVTALNSFHGRTIATITATGQTKYQKGFEPLPAGFSYVPFN